MTEPQTEKILTRGSEPYFLSQTETEMIAYSPTLALITGILEMMLAAWALTGPGRSEVKWPTAATLFLLGGYQLLEVLVCGNTESLIWARLAFSDIIWLPALGIWLITLLAWPGNKRYRRLAQLPFIFAGVLTVWVLVSDTAMVATVCQAVVAAYETDDMFLTAYGIFYQLGMLAMMGLATIGLGLRTQPSYKDRQHLIDIALGTLFFTFMASMAERAFPDIAVGATPSVMCHFAISLAIGLGRISYRERRP